jgi:tyrosine-protein kinase Etk/Wzc
MQLDSQAKVIIEAVGQLRAQIAETEVELHALELSATKENPEYLRLKERLSGLRAQLAKLETQENGTGDMQVPTGKLPELGLEYMRHYRDFKYHETVFEFLAKQLEVARIDEAREGAIIQVVDNAVTPDKKSWPKKGLITLLGTLFGLVFSILGVFALHTWSRQTGSSQMARIEELKRLWAK